MPYWLVFLLFATAVAGNCPPGSKYDSYFNKCYQYFPSPLPYLAAEQKCNSIGGHLADVQNAFENFYVAGEGGSSNFWIGANLLLSSNWTWTSNLQMSFTNWASGQPVYPNACAYVKDVDHTWGSLSCNTALPFMCTMSPNATVPDVCPTQATEPTGSPSSVCSLDAICSIGYTLYRENCICYKYFNDSKSFTDANNACASDGGMLAKIPSQDVNDFLTVLPGFMCWSQYCPYIGLSCTGPFNSMCSWTDGTPLGNYTNFLTHGEEYLILATNTDFTRSLDGKWETVESGKAFNFLCQKDSTRRLSVFLEKSAKLLADPTSTDLKPAEQRSPKNTGDDRKILHKL